VRLFAYLPLPLEILTHADPDLLESKGHWLLNRLGNIYDQCRAPEKGLPGSEEMIMFGPGADEAMESLAKNISTYINFKYVKKITFDELVWFEKLVDSLFEYKKIDSNITCFKAGNVIATILLICSEQKKDDFKLCCETYLKDLKEKNLRKDIQTILEKMIVEISNKNDLLEPFTTCQNLIQDNLSILITDQNNSLAKYLFNFFYHFFRKMAIACGVIKPSASEKFEQVIGFYKSI